jgi:hypothetical protein
MNWSAASSRASASDSSSTTSGDDNEPLTIQDIEKWHNRTTMQQNQSSFNTGTSTLENNTIGTNDTAEEDEQNNNTNNNNNNRGTVGGGETEGSSSPELDLSAVSAEGGNNDAGNDDNNNNKSNNAGNRSPRQVVAGLPWRDSNGNEGMYTGEVNSSNVPDGLGLLRYNKQQQQQQEGEWSNGKLIRRKSQHKDANALSTIEEEKSVKAPSIKYTEEFANFLAAKQIGVIGYDNHSQSSNSMDAHTTGEQSNARDFADSGLFSSTSTRQSNLWASTNSRKSHIYSSTNSRPTSAEFVSSTMSSTPELHQQQHHHHQQQEKQQQQQQQQQQQRQQEEKQQQQQQQEEKQKQQKQQQPIFREKNQLERSRDETTTFEGSESESDRNSISSSDYDHRNSQQQQQYHHEELGLVAVKEEERGSDGNSYRSGSGRGDYNRGDNHHHHHDEKRDHRRDEKVHSYRNGSGRGDNRDDDHYDEKMDHRRDKKVPHDAVHAIKKLMANENEYESEEDSDDEHDNDGVVKRAPPPQNRHGSLNSAMFNWHLDPDEKDDDDDEMRPSLDTHLQSEQQQQKGKKEQQKSRRDSNLNPYDDDLDSKGGSRFRKRKWCYLFSACCVLSIVGIALISWALVRMRTNSTNDANNDVLNSQPGEKDDTGTKVSLSWTLEKDVPCAHITIDIVTDQYGNETTWALYHLTNVNNETSMLQATRSSLTEVGHRKRLRPVALSDSNRKMEDSQVKSGGPYTYTSDAGANYTSPVYTSSVCLPEGNYKFVMSDVNGMCCQNGLGQYSIYFNGGRTVHAATGVFMEEEITPFEVTRDDVLAALASASPSQSLSPSTTVSCCVVRVHMEHT